MSKMSVDDLINWEQVDIDEIIWEENEIAVDVGVDDLSILNRDRCFVGHGC